MEKKMTPIITDRREIEDESEIQSGKEETKPSWNKSASLMQATVQMFTQSASASSAQSVDSRVN